MVLKKNDPKYYEPSGYNSGFDFQGNDFHDYIDFMRNRIRRARLDLRTDYPETILDANVPFAWLPKENGTGKKRGVLLVHGLFDSPFSLRDLGHIFYAQNFLVYGLLLPGHGTVPGDLLNIHYRDWQQALDFGVKALKEQVDEVYLCGFSSGGLLCLDYHLRHTDTPLKGIITLAPALKIKFVTTPLAPMLSHISPWLQKKTEDNYSKYRSVSLQATAQIYHLGIEVRKEAQAQNGLRTRLFMTFSEADFVIAPKASVDFFCRYASEDSVCLIYKTKGSLPQDKRFRYVEGIFPDNPPYVLKHNGLPFSPKNIHYGLQADYKKEDRGELLYNPGFSQMAKAVTKFLYP